MKTFGIPKLFPSAITCNHFYIYAKLRGRIIRLQFALKHNHTKWYNNKKYSAYSIVLYGIGHGPANLQINDLNEQVINAEPLYSLNFEQSHFVYKLGTWTLIYQKNFKIISSSNTASFWQKNKENLKVKYYYHFNLDTESKCMKNFL